MTHVPPFYRRLWFVVVATASLIAFPLALLVLASGDVYRCKNGALIPIRSKTRMIYAGALGIWLVAVIVNLGVNPDSWENNDPNIGKAQAASSESVGTAKGSTRAAAVQTKSMTGIPECNDATLKVVVTKAIQRAHDRAGMPVDPVFRLAIQSMNELDNTYARQLKRTAEANSNGQLRADNTRVCAPTDPDLRDFGTVLVSGDHKSWGGIVMNTPFPTPIPFGD